MFVTIILVIMKPLLTFPFSEYEFLHQVFTKSFNLNSHIFWVCFLWEKGIPCFCRS